MAMEILNFKFEIRNQRRRRSRLDTDGDVDTGWQVELLELIHGASCRIDDVEKALVSADFELLHRLLVNVNRAVDRKPFDTGRKRDRAGNTGSRAFCGLHDFLGGAVDGAMVEGAQADADFLIFHGGEVV